MPNALSNDFARRLVVVIIALALALFFWAVRDAVLLAFAAVLLAVAVHGTADLVPKKANLPRAASLGLSASLLVGVLCAIVFVFGYELVDELSGVIERLPEAWERARETLNDNAVGASLVAEIEKTLSGQGETSLQDMVARAGSYTLPLASGLTTALLVVFVAAFFTTGARTYRRGALLLSPKGVDEKVGEALDASAQALKRWLFGTFMDMVIIAALLGVTLWALGVPAFVGLALIAGIAQFVPTIGPLAAAIPGILLAFTVSPATALWTAIGYIVVSQVEANAISPIIQKNATSIAPALNLLAVLAFGMLLGPLGILLATPMLVVFSIFIVKLYVRDTLGKEADFPGA